MAATLGEDGATALMVPRDGNDNKDPVADSDPRYHNQALPSGADFLALGSKQPAQV